MKTVVPTQTQRKCDERAEEIAEQKGRNLAIGLNNLQKRRSCKKGRFNKTQNAENIYPDQMQTHFMKP